MEIKNILIWAKGLLSRRTRKLLLAQQCGSYNRHDEQGSINGSETVTIKQVISNAMMSYMVFDDDNSLAGSTLGPSQADITVTDGTNTVKETIPEFTEDTVAGARYWLAGCVQNIGETLHYVPVT